MKTSIKMLMILSVFAIAFIGIAVADAESEDSDADDSRTITVYVTSTSDLGNNVKVYQNGTLLGTSTKQSEKVTINVQANTTYRLVATAGSGYEFQSYGLSSALRNYIDRTANPCEFSFTSSEISTLALNGNTINTNFQQSSTTQYGSVTIWVGSGSGTIRATDGTTTITASNSTHVTGSFEYGNNVTVTYTAASGYEASRLYYKAGSGNWSSTTSPSFGFTVNAISDPHEFYATFTAVEPTPTYATLKITSKTGGSVTVSSGSTTLGIVTAGNTRTFTVDPNGTYTLTATPDPGMYFTGFAGSSTAQPTAAFNPSTIMPQGAYTYSRWANFSNTPLQVPLTVSVASDQHGKAVVDIPGQSSVTLSPGDSQVFTVNADTTVTATAIPDEGYRFLSWYNGYGSSNPLQLTIQGQTAFEPRFSTHQDDSVNVSNDAGGTVTISVNGTAVSTIASNTSGYVFASAGDTVTITTTPGAGNQFYQYQIVQNGQGGYIYSSQNPYTFTSSGDIGFQVHYLYPLYITAGVGGTVSVVQNPGYGNISEPITVPEDTTMTIMASSDFVNLTAIPNAGERFITWSGTTTTTLNPWGVYPVDGGKYCYANFREVATIIVESQGHGTVSGGGTYYLGDEVTITGTPDSGYVFHKWNNGYGTDDIHDNPYTFTITQDMLNRTKTYLGYFIESTDAAVIVTNHTGQGTTTGGGNYALGDTVTINATPGDDYQFTSWTQGNNRYTINPYSFTVTQDMIGVTTTYTANFTPNNALVWWDNGYFNGRIEIAFNFDGSENTTHSMRIPLLSYDGVEGDGDGYDEFSSNGYTLLITNGYNRNITCRVTGPSGFDMTYEPYQNGWWKQYVLKIDVQEGKISFQGIDPVQGAGGFSFINYTEVFEKDIIDISDSVKGMAFSKVYHSDSGTGDHPHFQVVNTTTYLNTYGFVMVDPTLNIYEKFPNYDNLRLNLYSFAYYGDSVTINGRTYQMDGSKVVGFYYIPKGTTMYDDDDQIIGTYNENVVCDETDRGATLFDGTLNNIYITWTNIHSENPDEMVCYLTFNDAGITINMGTYAAGDLTISMAGVWYFTTAIYEPYIGYESSYDMDWNSPFNMSKPGFILTFIGVALVSFLILNMFYKPGFIDYIIVAGAGLIAFILL